MTSSNVANMLISAGTEMNVELNTLKDNSISKMDDAFSKTLQSFSNATLDTDRLQSDVKQTESMTGVKVDSTADSKIKKTDDSELQDTNEPLSEDELTELKEKVDDFSDKVKDVIKDELDVSDEDIESAMEILGLTAIDLMEPQNVAKLVMELNGDTDSFSLLVSDEFKNILDQVSELTNQLFEETDLVPVEIKEMVISFDVPENLPETSEQAETEAVVETNPEQTESLPVVENVTEETVVEEVVSDETVSNLKQEVVSAADRTDTVKTEETETSEEESTVTLNVTKTTSETNETAESKSENKDFSEKRQSSAMETNAEDETIVAPFEAKTEFTYTQEVDEVTLPTGETVSTQEIIDQIVEQTKMSTDAETTTIEMTLNPEGLGKVYMEVSQKGDEVTAKIFTENEVVKEALENQMASLRTQLNDSSSKITSIEVTVGTHEFEKNLEEDAKNQQNTEEQARQNQPKRNHFNLNNLDELSGLMTEEEQLAYQIMRENGNTLDYHA